MRSITVLMPAYNEADNLPVVVKEAADVLASLTDDWSILVVDDGSTDGTQGVLRDIRDNVPQLRWVRLRRNFGKSPALAFDTCLPFGFNPRQHNAWMYEAGGEALVHDLYADFNIISFPSGNTGAQMGGWFRRRIDGLDDMRGLRMRIPGLGGKVMAELGVISADEARDRRDRKMRAAESALDSELAPLPENVGSLRSRGKFPTYYWGGAVYWERVDARLRSNGSSLQAALSDYLSCCRLQRRSLDDLAGVLDEASGTRVFSNELDIMRREPGCPERMVPGP